MILYQAFLEEVADKKIQFKIINLNNYNNNNLQEPRNQYNRLEKKSNNKNSQEKKSNNNNSQIVSK